MKKNYIVTLNCQICGGYYQKELSSTTLNNVPYVDAFKFAYNTCFKAKQKTAICYIALAENPDKTIGCVSKEDLENGVLKKLDAYESAYLATLTGGTKPINLAPYLKSEELSYVQLMKYYINNYTEREAYIKR